MNAKLEVIRMANDDVIATSASCAHLLDGVHLLCTMDDGEADNNYSYEYDSTSGKLKYKFSLKDSFLSVFGINSDGWWYSADSNNWTKCEDQSNAAHPVKHPD